MKYWEKDRNYRKYTNTDGTVRYVITVDGTDVEVNAEVYRAYSQADRRERYCREREKGVLLSLERMDEDNMRLGYLAGAYVESAEHTAIQEIMIEHMMEALALLHPEEQELLNQLFFQNIPVRKVARAAGVYHRTIIYRRDKALKKLLRLMRG